MIYCIYATYLQVKLNMAAYPYSKSVIFPINLFVQLFIKYNSEETLYYDANWVIDALTNQKRQYLLEFVQRTILSPTWNYGTVSETYFF